MAHSDEKYQCEKMSDCPYTGTTVINKLPWGDWPAGEDDGEEDQAAESDTDREEEILTEEPVAQEREENVEMKDRETEESIANSQALSNLQLENRQLREKLICVEEEKDKSL